MSDRNSKKYYNIINSLFQEIKLVAFKYKLFTVISFAIKKILGKLLNLIFKIVTKFFKKVWVTKMLIYVYKKNVDLIKFSSDIRGAKVVIYLGYRGSLFLVIYI